MLFSYMIIFAHFSSYQNYTKQVGQTIPELSNDSKVDSGSIYNYGKHQRTGIWCHNKFITCDDDNMKKG